MELSWSEYKKVIEGFLQKIFNNSKLIEDYENEKLTNKYIYEFANEDNFYISYFCTYLENEMKQYQKKYYGLKSYSTTKQYKEYKYCKECGKLIEIKSKKDFSTKYCDECKKSVRSKKRVKYNSDYYNKHIKNKAKSTNTTLI